MTKSVTSPIRKSKDASCGAILDAAETLLARFGYKRMTMDDLAHAVGLSKGALYLRFRSKEEVAISCIDRINCRLRDRLCQHLSEPGEPGERVAAMLVERVMYRYDSVRKYYESFDDVYAALKPEILKRREHYFAEEAKLLAKALEEFSPKPSAESASENAELLVLATNALLPYRLTPSEMGKRNELHALAERLARFLIRSWRSQGAETQVKDQGVSIES